MSCDCDLRDRVWRLEDALRELREQAPPTKAIAAYVAIEEALAEARERSGPLARLDDAADSLYCALTAEERDWLSARTPPARCP